MALPVVGHVHLNDNTGVFEELRITDRPRYDHLSMGYRRTFGGGTSTCRPSGARSPSRRSSGC